MALTIMDYWCHTVGDALEQARQLFLNLVVQYPSDHFVPTVTLTTRHGFRAILWDFEFINPGNQYNVYVIVNSMGSEDTIPMLSLARQAGFSGGKTIPFSSGLSSLYPHFSDSVAMWDLYFIAPKSTIMAEWSVIDEIFTDGHSLIYASDTQKIEIRNSTVKTVSSLIPVYEMLRGQDQLGLIYGNPPMISVEAFVPDGVVVQATSGIGQSVVDALRQLALVDTEISFNNGATVYSIKSRSVTSP